MKSYKLLIIFQFLLVVMACSSSRTRVENLPQYSPVEFEHKGEYIAQLAHNLIGTPYRYGGRDPEQGFDCSGLVFYTHINAGEKPPRTSFAQLDHSQPVALNDLQKGDLLFYRINGKPSHVGIYIGDRMFIHAPSSGKKVSVTSMDNPYFSPKLIRAGRLYQ